MTDLEVAHVRELVRAYLQGFPEFRLGNREQFRSLVGKVADAFGRGVSLDELCIVVAMILLGPDGAGSPPELMRARLVAQLNRLPLDARRRPGRAFELAIWFGVVGGGNVAED